MPSNGRKTVSIAREVVADLQAAQAAADRPALPLACLMRAAAEAFRALAQADPRAAAAALDEALRVGGGGHRDRAKRGPAASASGEATTAPDP